MANKEAEKNQHSLISLKKAEKYCDYSADYLKLRARQGKLKARKVGRIWKTRKDWVREYEEKMEEYWELREDGVMPPEASSIVFDKKEEESGGKEVRIIYRPAKAQPKESQPVKPQPARPGKRRRRKKDKTSRYPQVVFNDVFRKTAPFVLVLLLFSGLIIGFQRKGVFSPAVDFAFNASKRVNSHLRKTIGPENNFQNFLARIDFYLGQSALINVSGRDWISDRPVSNLSQNLLWYAEYEVRTFSRFGNWMTQEVAKGLSGGVARGAGGAVGFVKDAWAEARYLVFNFARGIGALAKDLAWTVGRLTKGLGRGIAGAADGAVSLVRAAWAEARSIVGNLIQGIRRFVVDNPLRLLLSGLGKKVLNRDGEREDESTGMAQIKIGNEGVMVVPPSMRDQNIKQRIEKAFSDEVVVRADDERSGVIRPVFKEGEGEEYMYMLVPITEE